MAVESPWYVMTEVFIPRPEGSNQNYLTVKVNSREYIVPVGEAVEVPQPVAEAVQNMLDELEGVKKERPASGGGGNGVLIVNVQEISTFEQAAEPVYVADKTFAEVEAAILAGQYVVAKIPQESVPYLSGPSFVIDLFVPVSAHVHGQAILFEIASVNFGSFTIELNSDDGVNVTMER